MTLTLIGFILISLFLIFAYIDIKRTILLSGPSNAEILIKTSSALTQIDNVIKSIKDSVKCLEEEVISNSSALKKYKESLEHLDDTISSMHYIQKKNFDDIRNCINGIDENTRKLYGDLVSAVDNNDVQKLADVVRTAKGMIENYDVSHDTIFKRQEKRKCADNSINQYIQEDTKLDIDQKKFHELERSFDKYYDVKKKIDEIFDL